MSKTWLWIGKYVFVIVAALVLGMVLGSLAMFRTATLGSPRLTAAVLARFVSYGGAIVFFWFLGRRVSDQLHVAGAPPGPLGRPVLALTTLIAVPGGYGVLMELLGQFLPHGLAQAVDWVFIIGTVGSAVWLGWSLCVTADALLQMFATRQSTRRQTA